MRRLPDLCYLCYVVGGRAIRNSLDRAVIYIAKNELGDNI